MNKRRTRLIITRVLELLVLFFGVTLLLLQSPRVQTRLGQRVLNFAQENMDAEIEFSAIKFAPFTTLIVKDLVIKDKHPHKLQDTIIAAKHISASFTLKGLLSIKDGALLIDRLRIKNACFNLVSYDDNCQYATNLNSILGIEGKNDTLRPLPDLFCIKRADIENFNFTLLNAETLADIENGLEKEQINGIKWYNINTTASGRARNINFIDNQASFDADWIKLSEISGYSANVSGHCSVSMGLTTVTDTRLVDPWSDISLKKFTMKINRISDFQDFINKVKLTVDATASPLSLHSVNYFAVGLFHDSPVSLDIEKLHYSGYVNDFIVSNTKFVDRHSGLKADLDVHFTNITDFANSTIGLDSKQLEFDSKGLGDFINAMMASTDGLTPQIDNELTIATAPKSYKSAALDKNNQAHKSLAASKNPKVDNVKLDLSNYAKGVKANLTGRIEGHIDDLKANLLLNSEIGSVSVNTEIEKLLKDSLKYKAQIDLNHLDLNKAGLGEVFGPTSATIKSSGSIINANPNIEVQDLKVSELVFNNYSYSKLDGNGIYKDNTFTGNIRSNDPNLQFIFGGSLSNSAKDEKAIYKFNLALGYADLKKLNIDKRDEESKLSALLSINLRKTDNNVLIGDASINNFNYTDSKGKHNIGDIQFASVLEHQRIRMNLHSNFADISYTGDPDLSTILEPIMACSVERAFPSIRFTNSSSNKHALNDTNSPNEHTQGNNRSFEAKLTIKDIKEVTSFLHKDIRIANGTSLSASLSNDSELKIQLHSANVLVEDYAVKDLNVRLIGSISDLSINSSISKVQMGSFSMQDLVLNAIGQEDKADISIRAGNIFNKDLSADLNLQANLSSNGKDKVITVGMKNSKILLANEMWSFSEPTIKLEPTNISIKDFSLSNKSQSIELDGQISQKTASELALKLKEIKLSNLDAFTSEGLHIAGLLNAEVVLNTPSSTNAGLRVEMSCTDLCLNEANAGYLGLSGYLDDEDDLIKYVFTNGPSPSSSRVKFEGNYNSISKHINAKLSLNDFNPHFLQAALKSSVSQLDGHINGKVSITGPISKPEIKSKGISLEHLKIGLVPTGVNYELNGDIAYEEEKLIIEDISIKDPKDGIAHLRGDVPNLHLELDRLLLLDNSAGDFSGRLALSGNVSLSQNEESILLLDANLSNSGSGKLNLMLSSANETVSSLLQFKNSLDEKKVEIDKEFSIESPKTPVLNAKLQAKCRLTLNPGLEIMASLNKDGTNALTVNGQGLITADYDTRNSNLSLGGSYNINEGKYHFSAVNALITKDFTIEDGSSLNFAGDLMDTELDISATHALKASVGTLISDTTSISNRRLVNCGIKIADKIRNPSVNFSIDIPDLDPSTKNQVESALNTEDKISRQFLSLVVLGGFLPDAQSGIVNSNTTSSNFVYSNLMSIMSGQLNTVLQKFNIPLDLGLSYQQNDMGREMMDLAVSTQFFDNMVSVNGSVGNRKYSSTSDENVAGDLDINIKLSKDGHLRLNLFSHSADDYTNYLDNSQRNGIGVSYQKEYDNFRSFIRSLFNRKETSPKEVVPTKKLIIKNE